MTAVRKTSRRLRILLYVQHLSGVGHYVRIGEIAKALARRHDVTLTDGGRPVPRAGMERVTMLPLPRIRREGSGLAALRSGPGIGAVMRAREQILRETVGTLRPDVLVVEHYPFSKWLLGDEIRGMITEARATNPGVKVLCSVRDVQPRTRHEASSKEQYAREVSVRLRAHFDVILVHGDPALIRLEEQLPFVSATGLSLAYTGMVSEKPAATKSGTVGAALRGAPFVLASVGGGGDRINLLGHTLEAWRWLRAAGHLEGWKLVLCPGLGWSADRLAELARQQGDAVILRPFAADFLPWLQAARLSVSCAGYNTCANLLETRSRAVLVPDPEMSDQVIRASLLAARHVAAVVPSAGLTGTILAAAMLESLAGPPPDHDVALDGAERTCALIEEMAGSGLEAVRAGFTPSSAS